MIKAFNPPIDHTLSSSNSVLSNSKEYLLSPDFKITNRSKKREYTLVINNSSAALDGFFRKVLTINDQIPGPLIEANEGDQLEITVVNRMDTGLTIHWHGLHQNGSNWEDGVTGVTQCPIPPNGGQYTYRFNLTGQFGTFWYHSHQQNLMADGISGPLIVHSVHDPLKRGIDFDQEVVIFLTDWYHNTSQEIVTEMLSTQGYFGSPAAPSANSALLNGVGRWNCSLATPQQKCQEEIKEVPEFRFLAGERIRFRLINGGVHAMFFYSIDEHLLNVTEADGTGVHGPSDLHRLRFHNGQRYSVTIKTKKEDVGKSFYMRATMDSDCWAWVADDVELTALGIIRLVESSDHLNQSIKSSLPKSQDWKDVLGGPCIDLDPSTLIPIIPKSVPEKVVGFGSFSNAFGFEILSSSNTTTTTPTPAQIFPLPQLPNLTTLSNSSSKKLDEKRREKKKKKRQVSVDDDELIELKNGTNLTSPGFRIIGGPPPTPLGAVGRFFINNVTWITLPFLPILHDLIPGGQGRVNDTNIANIIFPTAEWYDLYLVNLDPALSHPYHLHALDMHMVAKGRGLPTPENLASLTYNTKNPLRRDTVVIDGGSFAVMRLHTDIPGAWLMHCHIGWHLAGGFAGVVVVQPESIQKFKIPDDNLRLCETRVGPLDQVEPGLLLTSSLKKKKRRRDLW